MPSSVHVLSLRELLKRILKVLLMVFWFYFYESDDKCAFRCNDDKHWALIFNYVVSLLVEVELLLSLTLEL